MLVLGCDPGESESAWVVYALTGGVHTVTQFGQGENAAVAMQLIPLKLAQCKRQLGPLTHIHCEFKEALGHGHQRVAILVAQFQDRRCARLGFETDPVYAMTVLAADPRGGHVVR